MHVETDWSNRSQADALDIDGNEPPGTNPTLPERRSHPHPVVGAESAREYGRQSQSSAPLPSPSETPTCDGANDDKHLLSGEAAWTPRRQYQWCLPQKWSPGRQTSLLPYGLPDGDPHPWPSEPGSPRFPQKTAEADPPALQPNHPRYTPPGHEDAKA